VIRRILSVVARFFGLRRAPAAAAPRRRRPGGPEDDGGDGRNAGPRRPRPRDAAAQVLEVVA
jgi:hypothetical protein